MKELPAIKVTGIAFVGHPVADSRRARGFYEGILGLKDARSHGVGLDLALAANL